MTCIFGIELAGNGRSVSFFGSGNPIYGRAASLAVHGEGIVAGCSTSTAKIVA